MLSNLAKSALRSTRRFALAVQTELLMLHGPDIPAGVAK
jgi:hypothetical protein